MAARTVRLIPRLAAALLAVSCLQDDGTRLNPIRDRFETSADEERELGFQFDREASPHLRLVDDLTVLEFVNGLGQELVRQVGTQPFVYRFRVIQDPSLNAFAVPGGYVYLHSGTILAATTVDQLAGVMAHEVAHVKARHYARMVEQLAIPNLIAGVAGIAATIATGEPALAVTAQAVNVALQLRYSRELETEADRLGANFMSRAGYDPVGMVRFFERIVAEEQAEPLRIPPYLFTHPEVKQRISLAQDLAAELRPRRPPSEARSTALRDTQARLARLVDARRAALPAAAPFDRTRTDALVARAERAAGAGERGEALAALEEARELEPGDPRVPFLQAQILREEGRIPESIRAYRSAVELDPSRALALFALGLTYKAADDAPRAIFYLEQAARRAAPGRGLRERAEWEIEKSNFPVFDEAGLGDGRGPHVSESRAGAAREQFGRDDEKAVWWARLGAHFLGHRDLLQVRWIDPTGAVVLQEKPRGRARVFLFSTLALGEGPRERPGLWTVETRFDDDVVDRRSFQLQP